MIVSRCCKAGLYIVHDYYVCDRCDLACDTMQLTGIVEREEQDDSGIETETSRFVTAA